MPILSLENVNHGIKKPSGNGWLMIYATTEHEESLPLRRKGPHLL